MSLSVTLAVLMTLQTAPSAAEILQGLDLTSFNNSTGPSRTDRLRRPADWSFSRLTAEEGRASLERLGENEWKISLIIIRRTPDGVIACFSDRAQNGGTYNAQKPVRIVQDDPGSYRVVDQNIVDPRCPALPGQG